MSEVKQGEGLVVTYTFRLGANEQKAFDKLVERVVAEATSEKGLEGGSSLLATINRCFDQMAFRAEAETRNLDTSNALLKRIAERQEEEIKARAAVLNTIGELNKRLKQLEQQQESVAGGQQRAPFRDSKNKPHPQHQQRNQKAGQKAPPAAPKTSEVPQRAKQSENDSMTKNEQQKEVAEQFSNTTLKDQVVKFAEHQAGP